MTSPRVASTLHPSVQPPSPPWGVAPGLSEELQGPRLVSVGGGGAGEDEGPLGSLLEAQYGGGGGGDTRLGRQPQGPERGCSRRCRKRKPPSDREAGRDRFRLLPQQSLADFCIIWTLSPSSLTPAPRPSQAASSAALIKISRGSHPLKLQTVTGSFCVASLPLQWQLLLLLSPPGLANFGGKISTRGVERRISLGPWRRPLFPVWASLHIKQIGSLWAAAPGGKCGLDFLEHSELESQRWEEESCWQQNTTPPPKHNWFLWKKGVSWSLRIPIPLDAPRRVASCCPPDEGQTPGMGAQASWFVLIDANFVPVSKPCIDPYTHPPLAR
nr:uncharacterized protein LOC110141860 [Odocoileus virginianus texanus]